MHVADELSAWYGLRDRLRSFIQRDAVERLPPLPHRPRLLDSAEDVLARRERLKRSALRGLSAPDTFQPTDPPL
jgi:hypothetical protein